MKTINATITFEMLGRPKEHLAETMTKFVETIEKEPGIKIIAKNIYEPKKVEFAEEDIPQEMFSTFAELDIESEDLAKMILIIFKYMPSHIEIISPQEIQMQNVDFNVILNQILSSLHHYDSVAKAALMNNKILASKIHALTPQNAPSAPSLNISYGNKEHEHKEHHVQEHHKHHKQEHKPEHKKEEHKKTEHHQSEPKHTKPEHKKEEHHKVAHKVSKKEK